jgi:hypothetical protein
MDRKFSIELINDFGLAGEYRRSKYNEMSRMIVKYILNMEKVKELVEQAKQQQEDDYVSKFLSFL